MSKRNSSDQHGQAAYPAHTKSWNTKKALDSLLGLANGLVADQCLSEKEILFLDMWLRNQDYLKDDPDVVDLLESTTDILSDGVIDADEKLDLTEQIKTVIEFRSGKTSKLESVVNQLIGIVNGVMADQVLNDDEIFHLQQLLLNDKELSSCWPGNAILARIEDVLCDGVITQEERTDLMEMLNGLTGQSKAMEAGMVSGASTMLPVNNNVDVTHEDKLFCLTGKFVTGSRMHCEKIIINRGGHVGNSLTKKHDYLVIGELSSRDWMFSSYGRKIEKAIELKEQGEGIEIISEDRWLWCGL